MPSSCSPTGIRKRSQQAADELAVVAAVKFRLPQVTEKLSCSDHQ
jgi:hypothetical protein